MSTLAPRIARIKAGYGDKFTSRREPLSSCCGAPIEKVYRSFAQSRFKKGATSCHPDDADYTELVCSECGLVQEGK